MRVVGVNIPDHKKIDVALTYIYGIGFSLANKILEQAGVSKEKRAKELTPQEVSKIQSIIENNYKVEGELRQIIKQNTR